VTQKSDIKRWSNQRGEGHLFNVTLMDETGEIRATAFNQVADELYPRLEEGKVYYVSRARVNLAKKKFSSVQNDYELALERNTEVEEVGRVLSRACMRGVEHAPQCTDTANLPQIKYNFVELKDLPNQLPEALIGKHPPVGRRA
jgi:replication factor A1